MSEEININDDDQVTKSQSDFIEATNTDTALAIYYLQRNNFNLQSALAHYHAQEHVVIGDFTVPKVEICHLNRLKIISWNIEGAELKDRINRTNAVIDVITSSEADIILLQELVNESVNLIRDSLGDDYEFYIDETPKLYYFCGIIIKKHPLITVSTESFEIRAFKTSNARRNMLSLKLRVKEIDLKVITAHLESTWEFADQRKMQLQEAFEEMSVNGISIFAGDLNLRDKELDEIGGIPEDIVDLWEHTGSRHELRHTWDPKYNFNASLLSPGGKCQRFDRMYLHRSADDVSRETLNPMYFEFEGVDKIDGGVRFPSDHWAIVAYLEL